ncbi:hypothetical protein BD410DRAFT_638597 [Rickenella mellea]|uniref:Uncharacterized protein n=1 Tax=Rickenella mellea TaxID=50990 RepID=A0A4Y7QEV3_9AGAM|nr:hypothetical protein BD410DRAFT_638597 [Rickenella mellea]
MGPSRNPFGNWSAKPTVRRDDEWHRKYSQAASNMHAVTATLGAQQPDTIGTQVQPNGGEESKDSVGQGTDEGMHTNSTNKAAPAISATSGQDAENPRTSDVSVSRAPNPANTEPLTEFGSLPAPRYPSKSAQSSERHVVREPTKYERRGPHPRR